MLQILFILFSCIFSKEQDIQAHSQIVIGEMYFVCSDKPEQKDNCGIQTRLSKGSATRISWKDRYYWLTAGHVCNLEKSKGSSNNFVISKVFLANIGYSGEREELSTMIYEENYDLCIIKAKEGKTRELAKSIPNNGDNVHAYAYPGGVYDKDIYPLYQGTWNGRIQGRCLVSVPVVGGSSGAAILNDKEQVVSVISSTMQGFQHFTLTVCLENILDFVEKADTILNSKDQQEN